MHGGRVGWLVLGFKPLYMLGRWLHHLVMSPAPHWRARGRHSNTNYIPSSKTSTLIIRVTSKIRQTHFIAPKPIKKKKCGWRRVYYN